MSFIRLSPARAISPVVIKQTIQRMPCRCSSILFVQYLACLAACTGEETHRMQLEGQAMRHLVHGPASCRWQVPRQLSGLRVQRILAMPPSKSPRAAALSKKPRPWLRAGMRSTRDDASRPTSVTWYVGWNKGEEEESRRQVSCERVVGSIRTWLACDLPAKVYCDFFGGCLFDGGAC